MTGMGVRSDSGFSLYTLSGNCSQCDWLKMAVLRMVGMSNATVFPCARFNIVLSVYMWIWKCRRAKFIKSTCRDWHKLRQIRSKNNKTNFQEKFLKKNLVQTCKTEISSYLIISLSSYSQELWFTHRWHHGDHSYFYWLVSSQLFAMLCHLSNPQQSTSPRGKKVKHPKMIERWKVEYETCMPFYCPRHVSQVKCLVTATGLSSLFAFVLR